MHMPLDLPQVTDSTAELSGAWIEPASGNVLARLRLPPGRQTLEVWPFTVDVALLITAEPDRLRW